MTKNQIDKIQDEMINGGKVGFYVKNNIHQAGGYKVIAGCDRMADDQAEFIFGIDNGWVNSADCKPEDFYIIKPMFEVES